MDGSNKEIKEAKWKDSQVNLYLLNNKKDYSEIQQLMSFRHPNIQTVWGDVEIESKTYLVVEKVTKSSNLKDFLHDNPRLENLVRVDM